MSTPHTNMLAYRNLSPKFQQRIDALREKIDKTPRANLLKSLVMNVTFDEVEQLYRDEVAQILGFGAQIWRVYVPNTILPPDCQQKFDALREKIDKILRVYLLKSRTEYVPFDEAEPIMSINREDLAEMLGLGATTWKYFEPLTKQLAYRNLSPELQLRIDALREKIDKMPRRKLRDSLRKNVTFDEVEPLLSINRDDLAEMLGIGEPTWKIFVHTSFDIPRWPTVLKTYEMQEKSLHVRLDAARRRGDSQVTAKISLELKMIQDKKYNSRNRLRTSAKICVLPCYTSSPNKMANRAHEILPPAKRMKAEKAEGPLFFDSLPIEIFGMVLRYFSRIPNAKNWQSHIDVRNLLEALRVGGSFATSIKSNYHTLLVSCTKSCHYETREGWRELTEPFLWTTDIAAAHAFVVGGGGEALRTLVISGLVYNRERDGENILDDFVKHCPNIIIEYQARNCDGLEK